MNFLRILPGTVLVTVIIFILIHPDANHAAIQIPLVAILGFFLGLYGLLGNQRLWTTQGSLKSILPIIRLIYIVVGLTTIVYAVVKIFILWFTNP